jgi:hypothetical protein
VSAFQEREAISEKPFSGREIEDRRVQGNADQDRLAASSDVAFSNHRALAEEETT